MAIINNYYIFNVVYWFYFIKVNKWKIKKNANFYLQNSWAVLHHPGDEAQLHSHGGSLISGVYYLKTDKNSREIGYFSEGEATVEFTNPNKNTILNSMPFSHF